MTPESSPELPDRIATEPLTDRARDYLDIDSLLTEPERRIRARVRDFVDERIRPHITDWYERAHFPRDIVPELGALGLLGMHLDGYGCAGRSAVEYGLAAMELEAGDSGLCTFVSVQGSLAMTAIDRHGSQDQKRQWLPGSATGELIGCFTRELLGGNRITLDHSPLRHADNLESVRTYEGTDDVHTLVMGQAITGLPAFR